MQGKAGALEDGGAELGEREECFSQAGLCVMDSWVRVPLSVVKLWWWGRERERGRDPLPLNTAPPKHT